MQRLFDSLDPVAFSLFGLEIRWYGLAYLAGFVIGGFIIHRVARRWGLRLTFDHILTAVLYGALGVIIGGRLGYVLFYSSGGFLADPLSVLSLREGGMSFHGGMLGVLIAAVFAARSLRMPFFTLVDLGVIAAPVGLLLGRLANFLNGELWGRVTTGPWGIVFPGAGPLPRHPSQLYEAGLEGVVLLTVMLLLAWRVPPRPRGFFTGLFLAGYGVARFLVEFVREPDAQLGFLAGGLTMGQLLSIPLIIAGTAVLIFAIRSGKPQVGPLEPTQERGSDS